MMAKSSQSDAHCPEAAAVHQDHQDRDCKHFCDGICNIAKSLIRVKSNPDTSEAACEACQKSESPMEVNSVTCSLAIKWLRENDPSQLPLHLEQFKPHLTRVLKPSHAQSFAESTARWASQGFPIRTTDEQKSIMDICRSCEFHRMSSVNLEWCGDCQCTLGIGSVIFNKVARKTEHCPRGKW